MVVHEDRRAQGPTPGEDPDGEPGSEPAREPVGPPPDPVGPAMRWAAIALLALLALGAVWWAVSDRDAPAAPRDEVTGEPERVQPLDWISFDEPPGAWAYDRISATTTIGWLGDRSTQGDLANLEISVEPAGRELPEVREDYRSSFEEEGIAGRVETPDRAIPGADQAVRLLASGTDEDVTFDIVVLLMTVEDRVVRFIIGSAGGPSMGELLTASDSVAIDREVLLEQLR